MKNKVLLIEDDIPTIDLYKLNLEKAGFKLEVIKWGNEAMERVEKMNKESEQNPDVVLLDIILPDINGIQILKRIREKKETGAMPVLILTNYSDPKTEEASSRLNAQGYFIKTNHTPKEIVKIIQKILRKK